MNESPNNTNVLNLGIDKQAVSENKGKIAKFLKNKAILAEGVASEIESLLKIHEQILASQTQEDLDKINEDNSPEEETEDNNNSEIKDDNTKEEANTSNVVKFPDNKEKSNETIAKKLDISDKDEDTSSPIKNESGSTKTKLSLNNIIGANDDDDKKKAA